MTLQQISYVLAVIEHGSFSRAAEACFVTQPTLSSQIAKLEDELGMQLLDRLSRPVRPVPSAGEIINRARSALQLIATMPALADESCAGMKGSIRIGIIPTLSQYLLPLFLRSFMDRYPEMHLQISELQSADIIREIRDFRLDWGILALPTEDRGLEKRSLFYEEFLAYLPPGDSRKGHLQLEGLDRKEMLLLTEGHCFRDQIIDICGYPGERTRNRIEFESGSLESLIKLVDQDLGYTLLPELAALSLGEQQKKRLRRLASPAPVREIGILSHPSHTRPALLKSLAEEILGALPGHMLQSRPLRFVPWTGSGGGAGQSPDSGHSNGARQGLGSGAGSREIDEGPDRV